MDNREVARMKEVFLNLLNEAETEIKEKLIDESKEVRENAYYEFIGLKKFNETMNIKIARLMEGI